MEVKLEGAYTCGEILEALKGMNFADVEGQGYMPLYKRERITDALHEVCGFRTDYQFITKQKMKEIQKRVREGNKLPRSATNIKSAIKPGNKDSIAFCDLINRQRQEFRC